MSGSNPSSASPGDWTETSVPSLAGRVAVVTGANTGIGYETARVLAQRGATVVLACRSDTRAQAAAERIAALVPDASGGAVETLPLDLASLASVRQAADTLLARHPQIDLLINNAGVMDTPYSTTVDGFERQFGTNHLGHFALTGLLLPALLPVAGSRIVTVSSLAHRRGTIDFSDLAYTQGYKPDPAYCRSKLSNLLFSFALHTRLTAAGASPIALAVHPGVARSELVRYESASLRVMCALLWYVYFQSAAMGALPTLRAATDPAAEGGAYYGPDGRKEAKGHPVLVSAIPEAHDSATQERLWAASEEMTGVVYPV
jgi:NAD(P)-dependent dehydrogenase (short-subunit alcohol dehydrogenase family)